jgi:RPA family protein
MRETARICRIADLLSGNYIVKEGWEPNYVDTAIGRVSRANIIGTVIGIVDQQSFILDDGTGSIRVRKFEGTHTAIIGEPFLVIGRPRTYQDQAFISPEIIKHITNPDWILYRKKELEALSPEQSSEMIPAEENADAEPLDALPDPYERIIRKIRELDKGDGAETDLVSKDEETEKRLTKLIEEGRVFSNRPGRVKVL